MKQNYKSFSVVLTVALLLLGVTNAWGQYGLYGSPDAAYSTQQAVSSPQQAVVYPPVQQQPIQPRATGPNLNAPSDPAASQYGQPQYQQPQYQQPQYEPQNTQPAYQAYHSPPSYQQQPAPQYQYHAQPSSPPFGSMQSPTPSPAPTLQPVQNTPRPVPTYNNVSPQPIAQPSGGSTVGPCGDTTCITTCESDPCCEVPCTLPWFASVSGLMLSRDQANRVWTSYQANLESNQIMNTQDIDMSWAAGGEINFGRSFCCGAFGFEMNYWQLAQVTGNASITNPNNVSTPLDLRYLEVGPAGSEVLVSTLFDNAIEHRLRRQNKAYNVELNALYYGQPGKGFSGYTVNWLVGVRFLKFDDDLLFSSLSTGTWGGAGGVNEGYLGDKVENNLVGFHVGFQARSPQWYRFSTFLTTKFGIFNNHIKNDFMLYRGDGYNAQVQPAAGVAGSYPVHSTANILSTVAEINLGIDWNFNERISAGIGYRVIAISGIGLADNQIPFYIVDIPEINRVDSNGDLLLHGAFANLTFGF